MSEPPSFAAGDNGASALPLSDAINDDDVNARNVHMMGAPVGA